MDNSGTIEAGGRTDLNVHSELANSGRLTLGRLKTEGGRFDNRQGTILARSADISSRHTDNRGGALAAGSLKLDGTRLDNRQGVIRSNTLSDIRLSDGLNNQQGEITTAGSLKLAAGDIASSGGSILAGQDLELTANRLDGSGTLAAGRDAALKLSADFDSSGDIEAGRKLSIESGGSIRNRHRLAGGAALDIRARHIDNRAEGKLVSGSNTRIGADTVDNRGARIEAAGGGQIAVQKLDNLNAGLCTEEYLADSRQTAYTFAGEPERYIDGEDGNMSQYRTNLVFRFNEQGRQKSGSTERKFERSDVSAVRRYQYSLNRYRQRIVESRPGEILIGGDLKAEGGEWRNSDSKILIGGTSKRERGSIEVHTSEEKIYSK